MPNVYKASPASSSIPFETRIRLSFVAMDEAVLHRKMKLRMRSASTGPVLCVPIETGVELSHRSDKVRWRLRHRAARRRRRGMEIFRFSVQPGFYCLYLFLHGLHRFPQISFHRNTEKNKYWAIRETQADSPWFDQTERPQGRHEQA